MFNGLLVISSILGASLTAAMAVALIFRAGKQRQTLDDLAEAEHAPPLTPVKLDGVSRLQIFSDIEIHTSAPPEISREGAKD
jgi:hypothetical protein